MKKAGFLIIIMSAVLFSCKETVQNDLSTRVTFRLADSPALYDKINIDIVGAEAIIDGSKVELSVKTGVYNILDLSNGKDTVIIDQNIPSGELSQVRLILGDNNTIVSGGNTYDLTTPSAQQSGLKLNVHYTIEQGIAYEYIIDFDAARSIVRTGNGKYILKPVIKVFTTAVSGSLQGVVWPPKAKPLIYAISSVLDSSSVYSDTLSGKFVFRGLPGGTYKLSVLPQSPYKDTLLKDIIVNNGVITKLDTIKLK